MVLLNAKKKNIYFKEKTIENKHLNGIFYIFVQTAKIN